MLRYAPAHEVRNYLESIDGALLQKSQTHARFLIHEFPAWARAIEACSGRGFAGWRAIARLDMQHAAMLAMLAVLAVVIDRFPALSRRLDLLIDGWAANAARRDMLLELHAEYARQHPDQARQLRRDGLEGLEQRRLLRPLHGIDELLARAARLAA